MSTKPTVAVHKFSSCDGCQLAFLNLGDTLLALAEQVDFAHFLEAGYDAAAAEVDIAFIEGSVSTPDDGERLRAIRAHSRFLITIGACATAGGVQALRNIADAGAWTAAVYARPDYIRSLAHSTPIRDHVRVDLELWGCPVNGRQVLAAIRALLFGVAPLDDADKVCLECKRRGAACVLVTRGEPCMGPVTRTGCGALCPSFGRDCYACYGPAENANVASLATRFAGLGLAPAEIARRLLSINNAMPAYADVGRAWRETLPHD